LTSSGSIELLGLGISPVDIFVSMERHPARGKKIDGLSGSRLIAGGGPVPTALCTFAKLGGGRTALVAAYGDDWWGTLARQELERFGVDHSRCIIRKRCPSALAFAWVETVSGDRTIVLDSDPRLYIHPGDIVLRGLPRPRLIHLDGRHLEAGVKLARWGRQIGARIMLDIGSLRNRVDDLFPYLDFFVCADQYAGHYFRTRSPERAAAGFRKMGIPEVVVTSGTAGSFGIDAEGKQVPQKAFTVDVVDVTGAGDVFHGAYLFGIHKGWDMVRKLRFASAAAALKCRRRGARDGIPTYRQTINFLAGRENYHA